MPQVVKVEEGVARRSARGQSRCDCDAAEEGSLPEFALIGAASLFVLGVVTCYRFLTVALIEGYNVVANMIDQETGFAIGVKLLTALCILATSLVTISGCIGYVGINAAKKAPICTYFFLNCILAMFFFFVFSYITAVEGLVGRTVERQSAEFCNATMHALYDAMLKCHKHSGNVTALRETCDVSCQERVRLLSDLGGCGLLEVLCHSFTYVEVGLGMCLVRGSNGTPVEPSVVRSGVGEHVTMQCCKEACDSIVRCSGFVYDSQAWVCGLLSPVVPELERETYSPEKKRAGKAKLLPASGAEALDKPMPLQQLQLPPVESEMTEAVERDAGPSVVEKPGQRRKKLNAKVGEAQGCPSHGWMLPANSTEHFAFYSDALDEEEEIVSVREDVGSRGVSCHRKDIKTVAVAGVETFALWVTAFSAIVTMVLVSATVCSCYFQYTLVPRRVRKTRGMNVILQRMLCPCGCCKDQEDFLSKYGSTPKKSRRRLPREDSSESEWSSSASAYSRNPDASERSE